MEIIKKGNQQQSTSCCGTNTAEEKESQTTAASCCGTNDQTDSVVINKNAFSDSFNKKELY